MENSKLSKNQKQLLKAIKLAININRKKIDCTVKYELPIPAYYTDGLFLFLNFRLDAKSLHFKYDLYIGNTYAIYKDNYINLDWDWNCKYSTQINLGIDFTVNSIINHLIYYMSNAIKVNNPEKTFNTNIYNIVDCSLYNRIIDAINNTINDLKEIRQITDKSKLLPVNELLIKIFKLNLNHFKESMFKQSFFDNSYYLSILNTYYNDKIDYSNTIKKQYELFINNTGGIRND